MKLILKHIIAVLLVFPSAVIAQDQVELPDLMIGSFNSAEQAKNDTTYYDITLHMYQIWPNESSTYLYVEQAVTSMPDKPYRQRVYHVEKTGDGEYASAVYKIPNDSLYIGKWNDLEYFNSISPKDLIIREGCTVYMTRNDDSTYTGSTKEDECQSSMRGASYATSVVYVEQGTVTSWDQGFDSEGKQVWGATAGPYIFKAIK